MDRARGTGTARHARDHGHERAPSRVTDSEQGPRAIWSRTALDHRRLRIRHRRRDDHHGHARRPHRPAPDAADRRSGLRPRLDPGRLRPHRRDPHRGPGAPRPRRLGPRPLDALADQRHVPRRRAAQLRHHRVDDELHAGRRGRSAGRRRPARSLLVGLGVPGGRTRHGVPAGGRTAGTAGGPQPRRRATRPDQRRHVAGGHPAGRVRGEGVRQGGLRLALGTRRRARPGHRAPCSSYANTASPTRCWTWSCSPTAASASRSAR
ncbi:hypothetical protein SSPIM334S_06840 [Streptomyces spiroverticillatus]